MGTFLGKFPHLALVLDLAERAALVVLFGSMSWTFLQTYLSSGSAAVLILLISEGSVVAFVLIRRLTTDVSNRPTEWFSAFIGTVMPLLARPVDDAAMAPAALFIPLMLSGLFLQITAKLTLRRSFGVVPANRGVKVGGPYRIIRHPMYAGYLITQIGFVLSNPGIWNLFVYAAALWFQIRRMLAEERLLIRDAAYRDFVATVPYRLAPGIY